MAADKPLTVAIASLGCPKNLIDSEKILAHLAEGGCVVGAPFDDADVIVVNTCGFLSAARDESLEVIAEAVACKKNGRVQRVVVAGCLVNRDADKLYELAPGIDAIVGVNNRQDVLAAVMGKKRLTKIDSCGVDAVSDAGRFRLTQQHTAYLRIGEGCSQKCSFCTIPAIRGPLRSKQPEDVLAEARELIADGAVELNVIAQDTTGFGRDLPARATLASLLKSLNRLDGAQWIRLMYAYPRRFSDSLIDAIAESENVVNYIDLPLQHISDRILRRMGRGVTRKTTEKLLENIRRRIPGVALRTSMIVGFPGESDADFAELLSFVNDFRFDALGVFPFSPEEGTPAAEMADAVPADIAAERAGILMLAQQEIAFDANEQFLGQSVQVLVDGVDSEGRCVGRHYGQAPDVDSVCFLTSPQPAGSFVRCEVVGYEDYDLVVQPDEQ